ncbi:site-specific integrase, partial [Methylotuvimicrobium alcaliphilum]|uniref:DNA integration/recombination/inversion protein, site-specific recombinase, phage integrase family n=1 Tax=Methylotuvimicrobium alcaliphilum (strain DSM 19304 / NCIMB 14124 / VKM B-2133 / 20Z) TaxID=1091494 RepID=G4T457_META2
MGENQSDSYHGTHSFRRIKASLIYPQIKNPRAEELLLNHIKLEGTERYLGVEVDDAMVMAEPMEV